MSSPGRATDLRSAPSSSGPPATRCCCTCRPTTPPKRSVAPDQDGADVAKRTVAADLFKLSVSLVLGQSGIKIVEFLRPSAGIAVGDAKTCTEPTPRPTRCATRQRSPAQAPGRPESGCVTIQRYLAGSTNVGAETSPHHTGQVSGAWTVGKRGVGPNSHRSSE